MIKYQAFNILLSTTFTEINAKQLLFPDLIILQKVIENYLSTSSIAFIKVNTMIEMF